MSTFFSVTQKLRPYISEGVKIIIWIFLFAAPVIFFVQNLLAVLHPYSLDYGEAPLIDQATRLAAGKTIYRADISTPPYTIANYPPLFVISLIPFLNWFNSPFQMARVVSVVATIFSAVFIGLTIRTFNQSLNASPLVAPESQEKTLGRSPSKFQIFNKNWFAALVAVACFIASPYVVLWSSLARIDSLALAFATAAIFVFARWPRARWGWVTGGLLLVAAAYTRQSYILAAPLAAFIWLWSQNKRRALALALLVGGLGIALFLLLNSLTDGGFFYNIVTANVNEFGWDRLKDHLQGLWETYTILLLMGILYLGIGWRARSGEPYQKSLVVDRTPIGRGIPFRFDHRQNRFKCQLFFGIICRPGPDRRHHHYLVSTLSLAKRSRDLFALNPTWAAARSRYGAGCRLGSNPAAPGFRTPAIIGAGSQKNG